MKTSGLKNFNVLTRSQYNSVSDPADDELWAVEVETYSDNKGNWYRIYPDGWCEQGGKFVVNSASVGGGNYSTASLSLLKPLSSLISWNCQAKHDRFNAGFVFDNVGGACSSVSVYQVNDSGSSFSNPFVIWQAFGYVK